VVAVVGVVFYIYQRVTRIVGVVSGVVSGFVGVVFQGNAQ
jgi:hypothetical protein